MFSDGYADQFGGIANKKFMKKNLLNLLSEMNTDNMSIQNSKLIDIFDEWKGNEPQTDDILIIGIKV